MKKVYECDIVKKTELMKILENEPYAEDSFARIGYIIKEGKIVGEENKLYLYISANEDFFKKSEDKLKNIALHANKEKEKKIIALIEEEEERATKGFGDIFG